MKDGERTHSDETQRSTDSLLYEVIECAQVTEKIGRVTPKE